MRRPKYADLAFRFETRLIGSGLPGAALDRQDLNRGFDSLDFIANTASGSAALQMRRRFAKSTAA